MHNFPWKYIYPPDDIQLSPDLEVFAVFSLYRFITLQTKCSLLVWKKNMEDEGNVLIYF